MDKETAQYIINYFSHLLSHEEKLAIQHTSSTFKLDEASQTKNITTLTKIYKEKGWLTEDQTVLDLLKEGYDHFELKAAQRILDTKRDKVFLNTCPKCEKLARTPYAKQCRHCSYDWHNK